MLFNVGYVEQMDIHIERATVREAFTFSASMRLPAGTPMVLKWIACRAN